MLTRRQFLAGAAAAAGSARLLRARPAAATLDPERLAKFVHPLPRMPRAAPQAEGRYRIEMHAAECQLHPDLPPTTCWTYGGRFPGPLIEARAGEKTEVAWVNRLPARHFLPVDSTLEGAEPSLPPVRAVVHLHGGRVPPSSDGWPEDWTVPGSTQTCTYPNSQEAALLFYHDHAMGLNRLNVYAGLAGLYVVRDETEAALPLPRGDFELPLLLCDRWLDPQAQLFYPTSGVAGHPWVPEVFGNCILVNGQLWPYLEVEPAAYRLRIANAANSRFFRLSIPGLPVHAIGSDQGLLAAPVPLQEVLLAPAERSDLVVDFGAAAGRIAVLANDGRAIAQFRVRASSRRRAPWRPPALRPLPLPDQRTAARSRRLTLDEYQDLAANPMLMLLNGKRWRDPATETPRLGEVEIWELVNLTDDTHPIHLHQVRFRILDRRPIDMDQYLADATLRFTGSAVAPSPQERGWKDTARCEPSALTRILVKFEPYVGRYLWHCHLLEHEANAMMRPLIIS